MVGKGLAYIGSADQNLAQVFRGALFLDRPIQESRAGHGGQ